MIVTDLFESAPGVAEALGDNRPKLGSKRDQGKSVRQWRRDRGMDESGMAEGMAQDEAEEEYGGWRAEFVNEINYNTFEVRVTNARSKESANFIVRPVDMISMGPTLDIETMDVRDLQTGQTESWTKDDPAPEGPIAYAIGALFYDDKKLQKKLRNIIDKHDTKGQDMLPGLDKRRSIGQEVDADSYVDSGEKTQAAMAKMKQGMAEGHGNYAGDTPVNLGGVSMKMIQAGDTVQYIDQQAQVVDMSPDRKYSRITIPSSSTTKTVLTSDLRQLGQGMAEADDEQLDELGWKDLGSKIFGSSPNANANATAAPGSLSTIDSAYMPNPATGKPYTGAELRAAAAQRAKSAAASTAPASTTTAVAAPTAPAPSVANVPAGYSKVTQSFKKPSTTPATPNAAGTIGTYNKKTGAATLGNKTMVAFKDLSPNIQKQLAGITEALAQPVAELLQMVETKEDVQRIKKFIDDTFVKHGAVNESAFVVRNQILEHVTQVGAQRRRDFAAQRTH
jgi:hypothetical protein